MDAEEAVIGWTENDFRKAFHSLHREDQEKVVRAREEAAQAGLRKPSPPLLGERLLSQAAKSKPMPLTVDHGPMPLTVYHGPEEGHGHTQHPQTGPAPQQQQQLRIQGGQHQTGAYTAQEWLASSTTQLSKKHPDRIPFYSDFRWGFGPFEGKRAQLEHEGGLFKMQRAITALASFQSKATEEELHSRIEDNLRPLTHPGDAAPTRSFTQPVTIYGAEREGKTGAAFCVVRAALDMGFSVLILTAPTKVVPVTDMVIKLKDAGFTGITCSLPPKSSDDLSISRYENPDIMVCASTYLKDIEQAGQFIRARSKSGKLTICIVDEADELVMGRAKDTPENEVIFEDVTSKEVERITAKMVAQAERAFAQLVQPYTLMFLVTATQLGSYMKEIPFYLSHQPAEFLRVRRSEQYAGIHDFECKFPVPSDKGGTSVKNIEDLFREDQPFDKLLQDFARREHPHDQSIVTSWLDRSDADRPPDLALQGTLLIAPSPLVEVDGGCVDISKQVCRRLHALLEAEPCSSSSTPKQALVICAVGKPRAFTCDPEGEVQEFSKGLAAAPIDKLVKAATKHWSKVYRFSHIVFVGFTLFRRSATLTFVTEDHQLCTPMYACVAFSKTSKLDADSQRMMRCGHDFGQHLKPDGYQIWVSSEEAKLDELQKYRKCEEDAFCTQERNPSRTFLDFKNSITIDESSLEGRRVTKRGLVLGEGLGQTTQRAIQNRKRDTLLKRYQAYLETEANKGIKFPQQTAEMRGLKHTTAVGYKGHLCMLINKHGLDKVVSTEDPSELGLSKTDHHRECSAFQHFRTFILKHPEALQGLEEEDDDDEEEGALGENVSTPPQAAPQAPCEVRRTTYWSAACRSPAGKRARTTRAAARGKVYKEVSSSDDDDDDE